MKKILLSVGIIAIVAIGAIGATRAYFSDTATMSGNTFTSGTMGIVIDSDPSSTATPVWVESFDVSAYKFANLYPGYPTNPGLSAGQEHNWQVVGIKNDGTIDGNATIQFDTTEWSALGDNLNFAVYYYGANETFDPASTPIASGLLSAWNHNVYQLGPLNHGEEASVRIVWSVPTTAGNNIQNQGIKMNTTFGLKQNTTTQTNVPAFTNQ